jgi:hypothetical protein
MTPESLEELRTPSVEERIRIAKLISQTRRLFDRLDVNGSPPMSCDPKLWAFLIAQLENPQDTAWKERTVAAWAMGVIYVPESRRTRVISLLRDVLAVRRPLTGELALMRLAAAAARTFGVMFLCSLFVFGIISVFGSWGTLVFRLYIAFWGSLLTAFLSTVPLTPIALPLSISHDRQNNEEARATAARSLMRLNALEAMPELLQGAGSRIPQIIKPCRAALRVLLPQITQEHLVWMPANGEQLLGDILLGSNRNLAGADRFDPKLSEVILNHLEAFGQGSSLRAVTLYIQMLERHAASTGDTPLCPTPDAPRPLRRNSLVEKALHVHAVLQERQENFQFRQELLRHSTQPASPTNELLRPATDGETVPPEQLLRAHNVE